MTTLANSLHLLKFRYNLKLEKNFVLSVLIN